MIQSPKNPDKRQRLNGLAHIGVFASVLFVLFLSSMSTLGATVKANKQDLFVGGKPGRAGKYHQPRQLAR